MPTSGKRVFFAIYIFLDRIWPINRKSYCKDESTRWIWIGVLLSMHSQTCWRCNSSQINSWQRKDNPRASRLLWCLNNPIHKTQWNKVRSRPERNWLTRELRRSLSTQEKRYLLGKLMRIESTRMPKAIGLSNKNCSRTIFRKFEIQINSQDKYRRRLWYLLLLQLWSGVNRNYENS